MRFKIIVTQLVPDSELTGSDKDENPSGTYRCESESADSALEEFHLLVPIKMLEHFEINVEEDVCERTGS